MSAPAALVAVDAGGSGSRVLVREDSRCHRREFASLNPASVGADAAARTLAEVAAFIAAAAAGRRVSGWWASATVGQVADGGPALQVRRELERAGVDGRFLLSNDLIPLLFAPPLSGCGAVVVAGTGSGFWAADGRGNVRVTGGYEYLASDEGSAFDLGLHGVRRAARALDGRAGGTAILDRLVSRHGPDVIDFFRSLAVAPDPKQTMAALAEVVTACWLAGDPAATELVTTAAAELCQGLRAVRRAAGLAPGAPTLLTGGMFTGCPRFAELVTGLIRDEYGPQPVTVAGSAVHGVAEAAAAVAGSALPLSAGSVALVHEFDTTADPAVSQGPQRTSGTQGAQR